MSEFKGTPGPWRIIKNMGFADFDGNKETDDHNNGMGFVGDGDERVCWFGNCESYYPTEGDEPNEYDARLIEAAPELLEVVMRIANGERSDDGHTSIREAAIAAIAKALGEQK